MQSTTAICPSLFNATSARDGILSRIRLPSGLITSIQCEAIADLVKQFGNEEIQITNRANIQLRTSQPLTLKVLQNLQDYGLASRTDSIDSLRNIMASPTAGIDIHAKINTIPFVKQWDAYLSNHPELEILSSKFSVCFDGGETVSVGDRPNDICLVAVEIDREIYFSLHLSLGDRGDSPSAVGVLINPNQTLEVLAALTEVYRDYTQQKLNQTYARPPRLRELLNDWGVELYLQFVEKKLGYPLPKVELPTRFKNLNVYKNAYKHLGIHTQKQTGLFYIGVVIPLGRLTLHQFQVLGDLAKQFGNATLRLTPYQNMLVANIPEALTEQVTRKINDLGLSISANNPDAAIAACSGSTGCKAAFTNTQADAKAIATHLRKCIKLDHPINIHFSGCDKSCAQHHSSDIALVGKDAETYRIYVGVGDISFGRELYPEYSIQNLPNLIERLLKIYQSQRQNAEQSFTEFANKSNLQELKNYLTMLDYIRDGNEIYRQSFATIRAEANLSILPPDLEIVAVRLIHSCGMTDIVSDLAYSEDVVKIARAALKNGAKILCDAQMVANGVTRKRLPANNSVICTLNEPEVVELAKQIGNTRSAAALELWRSHIAGSVVAIGNAPTALFRLLEMLDEMVDQGLSKPAVILGFPVGFVGAVESKAALAANSRGVPFLTIHGRRGGSAMAAAALNALAMENEL